MGRAPCCDKEKVKRGPWSPDEDAKLKSYVEIHGTVENWISLPKKAGFFSFSFHIVAFIFFLHFHEKFIYLFTSKSIME